MMTRRFGRCLLAAAWLCGAVSAVGAPQNAAEAILRDTGVTGGIIVHLGCGDGRLTGALRANERYTVHGLAARAADAEAARTYLQGQGLYGPVAVEHFAGATLPYADGLVNLVVVEDAQGVPMDVCPSVDAS